MPPNGSSSCKQHPILTRFGNHGLENGYRSPLHLHSGRGLQKLTRVKDPKEKCLEVSTTDNCGKEAEPESA